MKPAKIRHHSRSIYVQSAPVPGIYFCSERIGDGPNAVSESTVSNTELSEFFCPHRVAGRELSEFLSAY